MFSERIVLKNTVNTRSLANLKNKNGQNIKTNRLFRSDALANIDLEDIKILQEQYQLKRIIDLRCRQEALNKPDVKIMGVEYNLISVLPNERLGITKKGNPKTDFQDFIEAQKQSGFANSIKFMCDLYEDIITSPFCNQAYRQFLDLLLEPVEGATLWHCSAGKDRAGFATILVLFILDFDIEVIIADYLATNEFYKDKVADLKTLFGSDYEEILWSVFGVYKDYADLILETVEKKYGGFANYIHNVLGFDAFKCQKLKAIYLEENYEVD